MDFCDSENRSNMLEVERQLLETGLSTEFKEDLNLAIGRDDDESKYEKSLKRDSVDDNEDLDEDMENSNLSDENSDESDNEEIYLEKTDTTNTISKNSTTTNNEDGNENEENEELLDDDVSEHSNNSKDLWEDIYGRQRDQQGNVVSKKYVPPAARVSDTNISVDREKTRKLERQFKGVLNRLAEQNMHTIANQVINSQYNNKIKYNLIRIIRII